MNRTTPIVAVLSLVFAASLPAASLSAQVTDQTPGQIIDDVGDDGFDWGLLGLLGLAGLAGLKRNDRDTGVRRP